MGSIRSEFQAIESNFSALPGLRFAGREAENLSEERRLLASLLKVRADQAGVLADCVCGGVVYVSKADQQATLDKLDECIGYLSKRLASS